MTMTTTIERVGKQDILQAVEILRVAGLCSEAIEMWLACGVSYREGCMIRRVTEEGRRIPQKPMSESDRHELAQELYAGLSDGEAIAKHLRLHEERVQRRRDRMATLRSKFDCKVHGRGWQYHETDHRLADICGDDWDVAQGCAVNHLRDEMLVCSLISWAAAALTDKDGRVSRLHRSALGIAAEVIAAVNEYVTAESNDASVPAAPITLLQGHLAGH